MKKQINLSEKGLKKMIYEAVQKRVNTLKEYNGSDAIEDYENGNGDLENGYMGEESPAGISDQDRQYEVGTFRSFCRENGFNSTDEALEFVVEFFEELGLDDMIGEDQIDMLQAKIDEVNDLYDKEISSHI